MDMETMNRLEREADERDQTAAVLEHWKRKAERHRFWAFVLNWRQVVDDPVAAVPTPDSAPSAGRPTPRVSASGVGSPITGQAR